MKLPIHSGNVSHLLEVRSFSRSPKLTIYSVQYSSFRDVFSITTGVNDEESWIADIVAKCDAIGWTLIEYLKIYRKGKLRRTLLIRQDKIQLRVVLVPAPTTWIL